MENQIRTRSPWLRLACVMALGLAAVDGWPNPVASEVVPLVGHPCDGCEAAFDGLPTDIGSELVLAPMQEPGERLLLSGRLTDRRGLGVEGVLLYLHQTNHEGEYPSARAGLGATARRHGRLRGWVRSGADGAYRINTIRPGAYPGTDIPQHIHVQVIEPGCATYFLDDVLFLDDPRLTAAQQRKLVRETGGSGLLTPERSGTGWQARRDIVLGLNVPGYPACGRG